MVIERQSQTLNPQTHGENPNFQRFLQPRMFRNSSILLSNSNFPTDICVKTIFLLGIAFPYEK